MGRGGKIMDAVHAGRGEGAQEVGAGIGHEQVLGRVEQVRDAQVAQHVQAVGLHRARHPLRQMQKRSVLLAVTLYQSDRQVSLKPGFLQPCCGSTTPCMSMHTNSRALCEAEGWLT